MKAYLITTGIVFALELTHDVNMLVPLLIVSR